MNLKNKTDKELWERLDYYQDMINDGAIDIITKSLFEKDKYSVHQEIIRRENDEQAMQKKHYGILRRESNG